MRWLTMLLLTPVSISAFTIFKNFHNATHIDKDAHNLNHSITDSRQAALVRLKKYTDDAKAYVTKNNYNNRYCFLVDMKKASGTRRFFIYDLKNDSIVQAGLVTHGSGINNLPGSVVFSNEPGSNCTSLGKYRIGKSYYGKFGLAYKLYGLDKTNSNAFNRFVVLHSHACVPDREIAPAKICLSWGCPTVSPIFLNQLMTYLNKPGKPVLLWIFN